MDQNKGFNRTFMELKVFNGDFIKNVFIRFQSHLYGIESYLADAYGVTTSNVSIAPLWN